MLKPKLKSIFIICRDLKKSEAFYQDLGFSLVKKKERSRIFDIGLNIELHLHESLTVDEQRNYGVQAGLGSTSLVGSYHTEYLDLLFDTLAPEYVLAGPRTVPWGGRILMLQDPAGHRLELQEMAAS